jgi:hypothetical protein
MTSQQNLLKSLTERGLINWMVCPHRAAIASACRHNRHRTLKRPELHVAKNERMAASAITQGLV